MINKPVTFSDNSPKISHLMSSAILLPAATIALYWYAFTFEVGYAYFFGYPFAFIQIDVALILNFWVLIFFYLIIASTFLQINLQSWPHKGRAPVLLAGFFVFWLMIAIILRAFALDYFFVLQLIGSLMAFIGYYLMKRSDIPASSFEPNPTTTDLVREIPTAYDARGQVHQNSIAYRLVKTLGFDPLLLGILIVIVFPGLFWSAGYAEAKSKRNFYLLTYLGDRYLAVRIFSDKMVVAPFDDTGRYASEFLAVSPIGVILTPVRLKHPPIPISGNRKSED